MYHFQVRRKRNRRSKREVNQLIDELKEDERVKSNLISDKQNSRANFI